MDLRGRFDRAVDDDPGADPGVMAQTAIIHGGRVRRRRRLMAGAAGAVLAVLGVVAGLKLPAGAEPSVTVAAAMMPLAAPSCSVRPVESDATDVALFLDGEASARERSALASALNDDSRVATVVFQDRAAAYERFRQLWADSPDFVAAVSPEEVPESFRLRLVDPSRFSSFRSDYMGRDGVHDVLGRICPVGAPVGGVQ